MDADLDPIGDKNFRGKDFEADLAELEAKIVRPRRKDERGHGPTWRRSASGSSRSSGPDRVAQLI